MAKAKKDNYNLSAKLSLRRHFLRKYHAAPPRVLDCCQGEGVLWARLRQEFPVASYWGLDVKPRKGRLKLDSARVLAAPGLAQDVVDIDTYGSPWRHWLALLPNVTGPLTVFLTHGAGLFNMSGVGREELRAVGFFESERYEAGFPVVRGVRVPANLCYQILRLAPPYLLAEAEKRSIIVSEAVEAVSAGTARYFGVRLEKTAGPRLVPETPPGHTNPTKEGRHV